MPALGDATANQEVVKPVDLGPVCSGLLNVRLTTLVHSIALSEQKVKHKYKTKGLHVSVQPFVALHADQEAASPLNMDNA